MGKTYQAQYAEILTKLVNNPEKIVESRNGKVRSNFVELIRVDLKNEFPLMDVKKISFNNVMHELFWFSKGDSNIKYLVDNGCNIWNDDAFRYYNEKFVPKGAPILTKENFIRKVINGDTCMVSDDYCMDVYVYGDMERIYGKQWREFNGNIDQLSNCIKSLINNPNDRRLLVTAHNPSDISDNKIGLVCCHNMFQFYTIPLTIDERKKYAFNKLSLNASQLNEDELDLNNVPKYYLNCWFNLRSNDFFLGQPYNMSSYALLTHIIANIANMVPNEVVCTAIDCHLYDAHIPAANEWLRRFDDLNNTICGSELIIKRSLTSIDDFKLEDIKLIDYNPMAAIKAPLLT